MRKSGLSSLSIALAALVAAAVPVPLWAQAQAGLERAMSGRCEYRGEVARHRNETTLILCDTASFQQDAAGSTFVFSQRSWGTAARFSGVMSGNKMAVSRMVLRDGAARPAKGSCEAFYRNDGSLSAIACLARTGSRSVAANFVPSRL